MVASRVIRSTTVIVIYSKDKHVTRSGGDKITIYFLKLPYTLLFSCKFVYRFTISQRKTKLYKTNLYISDGFNPLSALGEFYQSKNVSTFKIKTKVDEGAL